MTEMSNFQTTKTNFTFFGGTVSSFAMCVCLVSGPLCTVVAALSNLRIKVMLSALVCWLRSVVITVTLEKYGLKVVSSIVTARWLKLYRFTLLACIMLSRVMSVAMSVTWTITNVLSFPRKHVCISVVSCVLSYLLLVFSGESFWLLRSMELFVSRSLLRDLSCYPRFRFSGLLSVSVLGDPTISSKKAKWQCYPQEVSLHEIHNGKVAAGSPIGVSSF